MSLKSGRNTKTGISGIRNSGLLYAVGLTSVIFWILYGRFFWGGGLYMYEDIGGDTLRQYIPQIVYDLNRLHKGLFSGYDLTIGFGRYYVTLLYKYLNPVNWPLLFFGLNHLGKALVLSAWLKDIVMAGFSFLFFRRITKDEAVSAFGAVLWTFCSFAVLWGQHYHFLTSLAAFTVELYGLQLFLENDRKRILLIPSIAYLAYCGYVFLYISSFFVLVYSIFYLLYTGSGVGTIIRKGIVFLAGMAIAVGMAGEYILPNMGNLFSSNRVGTIAENVTTQTVYSWQYLLGFIGRLFSTDFLGIGNNYKGPVNYYEIASLSTSVLFLFAMVYLFRSRYRKRLLPAAAVCLIALCSPVASMAVSLKSGVQRWSFVLCMAEIIAIVFFLKEFKNDYIEKKKDPAQVFTFLLISDGLIVLLVLVLVFAGTALGNRFWGYAAVRTMILVMIWSLAFLWMFFFRPEDQGKNRRKWTGLIVSVLAAEMVISNYDTINTRAYITQEKWAAGLYNDETVELLKWLKQYDQGIYRVNKTFFSVGYNDQMIQDYNGVSIYDSTNPSEAVSFMTGLGYQYEQKSERNDSNWLRITSDKADQNTYMAVKYMLARKWDTVDPDFYQLVYEKDDYVIYKNRMWNGFGYFYDKEVSREAVEELEGSERGMILSRYFYYTDASSGKNAVSQIDPGDLGLVECGLLPYYRFSEDCRTVDDGVLHVRGTGEDMRLSFEYPENMRDIRHKVMNIKMISQEDSSLELYLGVNGEDFSEERKIQIDTKAGLHDYKIGFDEYENLTHFRIDPSVGKQNVCILDVTVTGVRQEVLLENLRDRSAPSVPVVMQKGDSFFLTVTNDREKRMLCIPLIYSECWSAYADGREAELCNINGGLTGLWLEPGQHTVELRYVYNTQVLGRRLGAACSAVYLVILAVYLISGRGKRKSAGSRTYLESAGIR